MIAESTFSNKQFCHQTEQTKIQIFSNKPVQVLNLQPNPLISKKNHLRFLVQKVNVNLIEDMVSSPRKRKDSQKQQQTMSRKSSTNYSQNSPRQSPEKNKNAFFRFESHKKAQQARKKSLHIIQKAQQYFEIKTVKEDKNQQKISLNLKNYGQAITSNINQNYQSQKSNFYVNKTLITNETAHEPFNTKQNLIVEPQNGHQKKQVQRQQKYFKKDPALTINDFDEINLLGVGVYGRVSLARHKQTKMLVALKKIQKDTLKIQDSVYLSREIKIQSFAEHPNIVQLYTFFQDQQNIYLVLQVCNEGNLYDLLHKYGGKFSEQKTKKYIRQICKAVQFLHNNQIIHRDLKPQNILVHNGVAKICDFGWAVHAPQLRHTLCGTPLYSSPEIIKKEKYDFKIDIWNIGIMTYQFLYGQEPFHIKTCEDLHKIVDTEVVFPNDQSISQNCKSFIRGCLQKVPQDRFQIWELLRHPFINIEQKVRESLMLACTSDPN